MSGSGNYAIPPYTAAATAASRRSYQQPTVTPSMHLSNGHLPGSQGKHTGNYSYLPPPSRKSPKLPHKQMAATGLEVEPATTSKIVSFSPDLPSASSIFDSFLKTDV